MSIRFVSPHLAIYKPQFNSILSIFNRITGLLMLMISVMVIVYPFVINGLLLGCGCLLKIRIFEIGMEYLVIFYCIVSVFFILAVLYHFLNNMDYSIESEQRPNAMLRMDSYFLEQLNQSWYLKLLMVFVLTIVLFELIIQIM